jgi:Zn-dependent protease with chaperone function
MHETSHTTGRHPVLLAVMAALAAAVLLLASAQPAKAAGNASDDQYGAVLGQESGGQGGSLPFTGLDLVVVLAAGTGLIAAGIAVRRIART